MLTNTPYHNADTCNAHTPPRPLPGATFNFFPLAIAYILSKILTHIIYIEQHYNKGK